MSLRRRATALLGLSVAVAGVQSFALPGAQANPAGTGLVISEVFLGGGSGGATYGADYVELYNPTAAPVSVTGMSVQYKSAAGAAATSKADLSGTVAPGGYYLVKGSGGAGDTLTPDATGGFAASATAGLLVLAQGTTLLPIAAGTTTANPSIVDAIGYGTANAFEGTVKSPGVATVTQSLSRVVGADTDNNNADFSAGAPSLAGTGGGGEPPVEPPPADNGTRTIAEIQGTGTTSPLTGTVTTTGVVTAAYTTGGFNGFYLQTGGTGGAADTTPNASDAIFVYGGPSGFDTYPAVGSSVQVSGTVGEFAGVTQITATQSGLSPLTTALAPVTASTAALPSTDGQREASEGVLYRPGGAYTITNNFAVNSFGELGLAQGDRPLIQPTEEARPGTPAYAAIVADNAARSIVLDDGASTNFGARSGGRLVNGDLTPPYLSDTAPFRVGATGTFDQDVIFTQGGSPSAPTYRFQPLSQVVGDGTGAPGPATFPNTRTDAPVEAQISAAGTPALKVASFNVLNYFTSIGDTNDDGTGDAGCTTSNLDNDGDGNTVAGGCDFRGAWDPADLNRQQTKIVAAINALDADVVGLMEIENSFTLGETRDEATRSLVTALNAAAGADTWAANPSSAELPPGGMDVISNAIIYKPAAVARRGEARALGTQSDDGQAFGNAREPLAQAFTPVGGGEPFMVVVNHFKSKGSAGPFPGDTDQGDGQGQANQSRIRQANALSAWVPTVQGDVEDVLLLGDFNSYSQEDPMQVLYDDGYENLAAEGDYSYSFSGLSGSLDHILANPGALERFTGSDVWNINGGEPVSLEYSRFNIHGTDFYTAKPFRSSDHDPIVVGLADEATETAEPVDINLLNINDFHGRIDANTTKFATTIEQLKVEEGEANSLFLSAGDNIGASLFPSSSQGDVPTLDILNALDLKTSAVGNHEFDNGFADLTGRVADRANFDYLGANVYNTGTTTPAMREYDVFEVGGVSVGVIGAVTQLTPELVTPSGVAGLSFGDPVEAVNRVATQLSDGDPANGEADVIVAEYHEGSGPGLPDDATCAQEFDSSSAFGQIARNTSAQVDAIFTGHTHRVYVCDGPVPGSPGETRPILQTGSYGENIGQIVLSVDPATGEVAGYTQRNVARAAAENLSLPRVAEVKRITDAALAAAAAVGNQPVADITADITTAYNGANRDNRTAESALGGLVANALRDGVSDFAEPDLGLSNPGGLRAELFFAGDTTSNPANTDGVVTFAEANAVLPFNNTVALVELSGAELKAVMEQQWRTVTNTGGVTSPAYLQLALSSNVRVTADASAPQGSRITSVFIDDEPLDLTREYTVSTLSFLAAGGDAFTAFNQGTFVDTGLLDAQLWRDYLAAASPVSPEFSRQQVFATGLPPVVTANQAVAFTLGPDLVSPTVPNLGETLNLTSLGSPANTSVVVFLDNGTQTVRVGEFPVTNGSADVTFNAPANLVGTYRVAAFAKPTGTYVGVPLSNKLASRLTATAPDQTVGRDGTVTAVVGSDGAPTGTVQIRNGATVLGTGTLTGARALVSVDGAALGVGTYQLTAAYSGDSANAPTTTTFTYVVRPAAGPVNPPTPPTPAPVPPRPEIRPDVKGKVVVGRTRALLVAKIRTASGAKASGRVKVRIKGQDNRTVRIKNGKVKLRLGVYRSVGRKKVVLVYLGNATTPRAKERITVRVVRP